MRAPQQLRSEIGPQRARRGRRRASTRVVAVLAGVFAVMALLSACVPAPPPGTSSSPSGYVDSVTGGYGRLRVQGWASDWDTRNPIKVSFLIGGEWVRTVEANKPRPDVDAAFGRGANFGYDETFVLPAGDTAVCVTALNVGPGFNSLLGCGSAQVLPEPTWRTVVNNGDLAPGSDKAFNSYNQPSVNDSGLVAFRARTQGQGARGVYSNDAAWPSSPIQTIADNTSQVPAPNNLAAGFNEFPSTPRIDQTGTMIATRGQSVPVWTYTPDGGVETRVGTSGVYATRNGTLTSAATLLGAVPGFENFAVPDTSPALRFDQFPGSPAVAGSTVVYKGNYTDGIIGKTGIFYRDVTWSNSATQEIASSNTRIPNQPADGTVTFGSTAPPSAADGRAVFTGLDIEAAPTLGGIYLAPIAPHPELQTLVGIGAQVPGGAPSDVFTTLGEGLSFDGRYVTYWGAWGETTPITLQCPADGNKDLLAYCNTAYPTGFVTQAPVHQGIFVYDTATGTNRSVVVSDSSDPGAQFSGLQYWTYSGKPPAGGGSSDGDQELPRWRSSAFSAVSGDGATYQVAFKATRPAGTTGIYLAAGPTSQPYRVVVDTTTAAPAIDAQAPADTVVSSVGIERDGFRGRYLALSLGMANADASATWGGIYLVTVDQLPIVSLSAPSRSIPDPKAPATTDTTTQVAPHAGRQQTP
jgi:hypothetical protein